MLYFQLKGYELQKNILMASLTNLAVDMIG